ncbi:MAG: hypothetical protein AB7P02_27090 [Alphaproteobacteria bacterium]
MDAGAASARALALTAAGDEAAAIAVLEVAYAAAPAPALAVNLGRLLWRHEGSYERGRSLLEDAAAARPGMAAAWLNLADARAAADDPATEAAYRRCLLLEPGRAEVHWSLATDLIVRGAASRAWPHFAWRARHPQVRRRPTPFPPIAAAAERRGALLVWSNEGVGEDLRYARLLADPAIWRPRFDRLILETDPRLAALLSRSLPHVAVVARAWPPDARTADPDIVAHAALADLVPLACGAGADVPGPDTWLRPDPARAAALRARYRALAAREGASTVVGLSWRSFGTPFAAAKSIPLSLLAPLLEREDALVVSLQYGDCAGDIAALPAHLRHRVHVDPAIDPAADLDGFAAQVAAMDLVVSSSNTTVHVAGALGVPVWALVHRGPPTTPYWHAGRSDTPWYRSARIWRQDIPGDWGGTVQRVAAAFRARFPLSAPPAFR